MSELHDVPPDDQPTPKMAKYGTKTASGNARIFNCKQCNRAFTREEHLTRHTLLTHNKLKPFICGICSRPFSRRDLLLRHAKNLHQGSELAVSRIRRLYRKKGDSDDEEEEPKSSPPLLTMEYVAKPVEATPKVMDLDEYETPQKSRMKMLVNMLVS